MFKTAPLLAAVLVGLPSPVAASEMPADEAEVYRLFARSVAIQEAQDKQPIPSGGGFLDRQEASDRSQREWLDAWKAFSKAFCSVSYATDWIGTVAAVDEYGALRVRVGNKIEYTFKQDQGSYFASIRKSEELEIVTSEPIKNSSPLYQWITCHRGDTGQVQRQVCKSAALGGVRQRSRSQSRHAGDNLRTNLHQLRTRRCADEAKRKTDRRHAHAGKIR